MWDHEYYIAEAEKQLSEASNDIFKTLKKEMENNRNGT